MSKKEAKKVLIKDIAIALIAWVVSGILMGLLTSGEFNFSAVIAGFVFAGIPFGWNWTSKVVVATSIPMAVIKFIFSIFVGWVAVVIILVKDVIVLVNAKDDEEIVVLVTDEDTEE